MRWINCKKSELQGLQCTNPERGIYLVALSPSPYVPKETEEMGEGTDTRCIIKRVEHRPNVHELRQWVTGLQQEYDNSREVNGFTIGNSTYWLDKATRVGLMNSISVKKAVGAELIELWMGSQKLVVDLDYAEQFLTELELYAMECYNVTAQHLAEIKTLDSMEQLLEYDITQGYPEKISLDVTKIVGQHE